MSYSLHITRRKHWFESVGPTIAVEEWERFVATDPELHMSAEFGDGFATWRGPSMHDDPWIAWDRGNLESKNPDQPLIEKMISIADKLDARVVGDEGEEYYSGGIVRPPPSPNFAERVSAWVVSLGARLRPTPVVTDLPFVVGSRVRDAVGRRGTVSRVDVKAQHGLGTIVVTYDDGRTAQFSAIAHGLSVSESSESGI